jgi:hypothetical protein
LKEKISNSYPYVGDVIRSKTMVAETCTYEQLMSYCEQWMDDSLAIAKEVRNDLKNWSESEIIKSNNRPIKNEELLALQNRVYLYRGFFLLPFAYRKIFNLPKTILEYSKYFETKDFAKSYPQSNREILKDWENQFFVFGTKQFEWREKYNAAMKEIFDETNGIEAMKRKDERFSSWGSPHLDKAQAFPAEATIMPT